MDLVKSGQSFTRLKLLTELQGMLTQIKIFNLEDDEDQDVEEEELEPEEDESEVIQVGQSQAEQPTETPVGVADDGFKNKKPSSSN